MSYPGVLCKYPGRTLDVLGGGDLGACDSGGAGQQTGLGAWGLGRGLAGGWQGANGACPVVKRKRGKVAFLFDGRVETADGANKRPLGAS